MVGVRVALAHSSPVPRGVGHYNLYSTDSGIAVVGRTEAEASEVYERVNVGTFPLRASGRVLSANETAGHVTVVAAPDETLLGVQIAGARASDMIAETTLALELDASLDGITTTIHAHPTFPEVLSEAAELARGDGSRSRPFVVAALWWAVDQ